MANSPVDKLIVSNGHCFRRKYGETGAKAVAQAVEKLIQADKARGLIAAHIDLGDPTAMEKHGLAPLSADDDADPRKNKEAIDGLFQSMKETPPAYLMLLGSTDVIPHVPLANPLRSGDHDDDVPSDLPYAHSNPYSNDIQDFLGPTRAVGRLPNVTGDKSETYLVGLIRAATTYKTRSAKAYSKFMGISAEVWKDSTKLSLTTAFGHSRGMKSSPPNDYRHADATARRLAHFVNCHGGLMDPDFYGENGATSPTAHTASWMDSRVAEGTVMAAECCYGALLYDPKSSYDPNRMSMCNTYLGGKASAYFGSTNISYGPFLGVDYADLVCRDFFVAVLGGASTGRACLQARLDYVQGKGGMLMPVDLKTLAQFNLMGDPSLTPVESTSSETVLVATPGAKQLEAARGEAARFQRRRSQMELAMKATSIVAHRLYPPDARSGGGKAANFAKLRGIAANHGIKDPDVILSYSFGPIAGTAAAEGAIAKAIGTGPAPKAVYAVLKKLASPADAPSLRLVRGVQVLAFDGTMNVSTFQSR